MSEMVLRDKIAIVTGASSGIGRATALRFAKEGAAVALVARSEASIVAMAEDLKAQGGRAMAVAGDLADPAFSQRVVEATVKQFGGIDCLVNSAGSISAGSIKDTTFADWNALMTLNLHAVFLLMQACVPHLVERKGNVVNVSSVTGLRSFPGRLGYCVSKAALDQLTRCAALELAPDGVRVNAVNPGVVVTNLQRSSGMDEASYAQWLKNSTPAHPLGRVGSADEVAELILFLASSKAAWITGVTYSIDGGRAQTCQ